MYLPTIQYTFKYVIKRLSRKNLHNLTTVMNIVRIG